MILTLAEAKAHLYVIHGADDLLITDCILAAGDYVAQYLGRAVPWLDDADPPVEVAVPGSIKHAAKLLVGDYYENRSALVVGTIVSKNPAAENLLHFYRVGLGV